MAFHISKILLVSVIFTTFYDGSMSECIGLKNEAYTAGSEININFCPSVLQDKELRYISSSDPLKGQSLITSFDNMLPNDLIGKYSTNGSRVTILNSRIPSKSNPYSSAGLYVLVSKITSHIVYAAKWILVAGPPRCTVNTDRMPRKVLTAEMEYSESFVASPIYVIFNWVCNGKFFKSEMPLPETTDGLSYKATSTIEVGPMHLACICTMSFSAPQTYGLPFMATNAPNYTASCEPSLNPGHPLG